MPGKLIRLGGVLFDFKADNRDYLRKMQTTRNSTKKTGNQFYKLQRSVAAAGKAMRTFVAAAATALAGFATIEFARPFVEFEDTVQRLRAFSKGTAEEIESLEKTILSLSSTTRFTASEVAVGAQQLNQAGLSLAETDKAIASVLALSQAGMVGMAEASNFLTATVNAMGLEFEESERVANAFAAATLKSQASVTSIGETFAYAAPLARLYKVSIEELSAATATLADSGIDSSRAGTGLSEIFRRLNAPSAKALGTLRKLGLTLADVDVEVRGLIPVLKTLRDTNLSNADAINIFGARAGAAGAILLAGIENIEHLTAAMESGQFSVQQLAKELDDSLAGSIAGLGSAWEALRISLLRSNESMNLTRDAINSIAESFRYLAENIQLVNSGIEAALTLLGGAVMLRIARILLGFTKGLGAATAGMGALSTSIAAFRAILRGIFARAGPIAAFVLFADLIYQTIKLSDQLNLEWEKVAATLGTNLVLKIVNAFLELPDQLFRIVNGILIGLYDAVADFVAYIAKSIAGLFKQTEKEAAQTRIDDINRLLNNKGLSSRALSENRKAQLRTERNELFALIEGDNSEAEKAGYNIWKSFGKGFRLGYEADSEIQFLQNLITKNEDEIIKSVASLAGASAEEVEKVMKEIGGLQRLIFGQTNQQRQAQIFARQLNIARVAGINMDKAIRRLGGGLTLAEIKQEKFNEQLRQGNVAGGLMERAFNILAAGAKEVKEEVEKFTVTDLIVEFSNFTYELKSTQQSLAEGHRELTREEQIFLEVYSAGIAEIEKLKKNLSEGEILSEERERALRIRLVNIAEGYANIKAEVDRAVEAQRIMTSLAGSAAAAFSALEERRIRATRGEIEAQVEIFRRRQQAELNQAEFPNLTAQDIAQQQVNRSVAEYERLLREIVPLEETRNEVSKTAASAVESEFERLQQSIQGIDPFPRILEEAEKLSRQSSMTEYAKEVDNAYRDVLQRISEAKGLTEAQIEALQRQAAATRDIALGNEEVVEGIRKAEQETLRWERFVDEAADAFSDGIGDWISGVGDLGDAFDNLGKIIQQQLIDRLIRAPIKKLFDFILPGFAEGGLAQRGLAIVGERGPELINFKQPARVYSNEQLRESFGGMGGLNITYAPVIQSADPASVSAALRLSYPEFRDHIKRDLARDAQRPSAFRSAIRG